MPLGGITFDNFLTDGAIKGILHCTDAMVILTGVPQDAVDDVSARQVALSLDLNEAHTLAAGKAILTKLGFVYVRGEDPEIWTYRPGKAAAVPAGLIDQEEADQWGEPTNVPPLQPIGPTGFTQHYDMDGTLLPPGVMLTNPAAKEND